MQRAVHGETGQPTEVIPSANALGTVAILVADCE